MSDKFEQYCIVELMGHQVIAGLVSEQVIGGAPLIRVDVPALPSIPAYTKYFGAPAIYAITPCDEATTLAAVADLRQKPISIYTLNLPASVRIQDDSEE